MLLSGEDFRSLLIPPGLQGMHRGGLGLPVRHHVKGGVHVQQPQAPPPPPPQNPGLDVDEMNSKLDKYLGDINSQALLATFLDPCFVDTMERIQRPFRAIFFEKSPGHLHR